MRSAIAISVLACLAVAGCTSSSGIDDFMPRPSNEVTSSISRPPDAPLPPEDVAAAAADPADRRPSSQSPKRAAGDARASRRDGRLCRAGKAGCGAAARQAGPIYQHRFRDAKPINFGKASPRHLAVHGVDVSRWQGNIDWQKLRGQGANFVYIKATDGGDHLDPMFKKNWRAAEQAGLKRGAYHFFYWCRTAGEQADWFIRNVPKVEGALPPVIDVEWNGDSSCKRRPSRDKVLEKMQVFMDKLERALRPAPDHLHQPGLLPRQSQGRIPRLPVLAARGGGAPVQGLSRPQMGVLAVFRLRPVARA